MSRPFQSGFARIVGWLLTPFVAWAASFIGGWVGAATAGESAGMVSLVFGGLSGGALGAIGWAGLLYWSGRAKPARTQRVIES